MSSTTIIPREKMSAYQRWELNSFDSNDDEPQPTQTETKAVAEAAKVQHIHREAYQAGHADGLREGMEKAAADAASFQTLLTSVKLQGAEINQNLSDELLGLATELARQMLRQALTIRPELVIPVVQDALGRVSQPLIQATITLHPDDAQLVRDHLSDQLKTGGWKVIEDKNVSRGGCMLQTSTSQVDATNETRWQKLSAVLGQSSQWLL